MTTIETDQSDFLSWRTARWVAPFFAAAALALVPWTIVLATRLPTTHAAPHWNLTWAGFDVGLTFLLVAVAAAAWRCSPWLEGAAAAAAALLLVDAWFDLTTSSSGIELDASLAAALLVELPIAVLCLLLARDAERVLAGSIVRRSPYRASIDGRLRAQRDERDAATISTQLKNVFHTTEAVVEAARQDANGAGTLR
jgi:hypothetical protein